MRTFWRIVASPARFYKRFISPFMPPACRFEPTCSVYAAEAIETLGNGFLRSGGPLLDILSSDTGKADPSAFLFRKTPTIYPIHG